MTSSSQTLFSGDEIPLIGFGTLFCQGKEALMKALEVGYRHIDGAFVYQNEDAVGDVLQEAFQNKIVTREELFITSKLPSNGHAPEKVQYFLKKSLARLKLTYVDLYLVHYPQAFKFATDDDTLTNNGKDFDYETSQMDTWKAMEECVDAGLAKNIGLSNYNSKQIQSVFDQARIKPSNLQVECHVYLQQHKLVEFCKNLGITVTGYSPFGTPDQAADIFLDVGRPKVLEEPVLVELAKKYNKTVAQIALRWTVQRGISVIPKSQTPSRVEENFQVFDFFLTEDDMQMIRKLDRKGRLFRFDFLENLPKLPDYPFHEEF